ncbi:hypothetical protein [Streptomyces flavidovirens]|uniref:hypothetical protein n=1 Tax=Streptomyces flavidovirens TaxID=67298 RepID=UPI00042077DA|nr:hypothetical protein [Streptomyces flavidovirens]
MSLPAFLLVHTVTVEAYLGDSAYEPLYAAPVSVRCFLDEQTKTVRNKAGEEATSSSTLYAPLETVCPAESRVTLPGGRQTTVITALKRDGGSLPTPDHLEVQLI